MDDLAPVLAAIFNNDIFVHIYISFIHTNYEIATSSIQPTYIRLRF